MDPFRALQDTMDRERVAERTAALAALHKRARLRAMHGSVAALCAQFPEFAAAARKAVATVDGTIREYELETQLEAAEAKTAVATVTAAAAGAEDCRAKACDTDNSKHHTKGRLRRTKRQRTDEPPSNVEAAVVPSSVSTTTGAGAGAGAGAGGAAVGADKERQLQDLDPTSATTHMAAGAAAGGGKLLQEGGEDEEEEEEEAESTAATKSKKKKKKKNKTTPDDMHAVVEQQRQQLVTRFACGDRTSCTWFVICHLGFAHWSVYRFGWQMEGTEKVEAECGSKFVNNRGTIQLCDKCGGGQGGPQRGSLNKAFRTMTAQLREDCADEIEATQRAGRGVGIVDASGRVSYGY